MSLSIRGVRAICLGPLNDSYEPSSRPFVKLSHHAVSSKKDVLKISFAVQRISYTQTLAIGDGSVTLRLFQLLVIVSCSFVLSLVLLCHYGGCVFGSVSRWLALDDKVVVG